MPIGPYVVQLCESICFQQLSECFSEAPKPHTADGARPHDDDPMLEPKENTNDECDVVISKRDTLVLIMQKENTETMNTLETHGLSIAFHGSSGF